MLHKSTAASTVWSIKASLSEIAFNFALNHFPKAQHLSDPVSFEFDDSSNVFSNFSIWIVST